MRASSSSTSRRRRRRSCRRRLEHRPRDDSALDGRPGGARRRRAGGRSRAGSSPATGGRFAEVALPASARPVDRSSCRRSTNQLQRVEVVRRRVLVAGGLAIVFAVAARVRAARPVRAADSPARDGRRADRGRRVRRGGRRPRLGRARRSWRAPFERMRLRLSQLDRARGEFIANASHELRTPLFSLGGLPRAARRPGARRGDARRVPRRRCGSRSTRLTKLATDLLDLSRLDAGRLRVAPRRSTSRSWPTSWRPSSARGAEGASTCWSSASGPRVLAAATPRACCRSAGSSSRTRSCTRRRERRSRISWTRDGGRATLTVADNGPGIPADGAAADLRALLPARRRRASGSGLGLAIARELAEVMGGRLELDAAAGWTSFTLVLSAADATISRQTAPLRKTRSDFP